MHCVKIEPENGRFTYKSNITSMRMKIYTLLAFMMIWFCSCQKDISEESGVIPDAVTGTTGTTGTTGSSTSNCKDCLYYPDCSGSLYHFKDTSFVFPGGGDTTYTYQFIKDTVIESKNYQKISVNGQMDYFNCTAGVSTTIAINATSAGGTTLPFLKVTNLKANEAVGASWADIITVSGQDITYTYTIVSKGSARTVAGITYPDVIHVHEQTTENVAGLGIINAGQTDYYYARGTGLIETLSIDDFSGMQIDHRVLINATIP
jgi:hypothetical protein